jgi:hypothetical protein
MFWINVTGMWATAIWFVVSDLLAMWHAQWLGVAVLVLAIGALVPLGKKLDERRHARS